VPDTRRAPKPSRQTHLNSGNTKFKDRYTARRAVGPVREHLLHNGMVAVLRLGLDHLYLKP